MSGAHVWGALWPDRRLASVAGTRQCGPALPDCSTRGGGGGGGGAPAGPPAELALPAAPPQTQEHVARFERFNQPPEEKEEEGEGEAKELDASLGDAGEGSTG